MTLVTYSDIVSDSRHRDGPEQRSLRFDRAMLVRRRVHVTGYDAEVNMTALCFKRQGVSLQVQSLAHTGCLTLSTPLAFSFNPGFLCGLVQKPPHRNMMSRTLFSKWRQLVI